MPGVGIGVSLVAVDLTRLREQDQRRGVSGLSREGEVEQDERVLVEVDEDLEGVEDDPDDDDDALAEDVLRRPEETGDPLGHLTEAVGAERAGQVLGLPVMAKWIGGAHRPRVAPAPDAADRERRRIRDSNSSANQRFLSAEVRTGVCTVRSRSLLAADVQDSQPSNRPAFALLAFLEW